MACELADQWGGYPWDIDMDSLPAAWVERSRLYSNFKAQKQGAADRKHAMRNPGQRRVIGG